MTVKRVGIVGSGIMGSGIAECAAKTGHEVVLRSRRQEGAGRMVAILDALYDEFRDPNFSPAPLLRRMVSAELLGRKSGRGFYDYHRV
jgi:3-hydroxyacyl-CoA dehydrogenase